MRELDIKISEWRARMTAGGVKMRTFSMLVVALAFARRFERAKSKELQYV